MITLSVSVQMSDQDPYHHNLSQDDKKIFQSAVELFKSGCGDLSVGELPNKSKCILGAKRLKTIVEANPTVVEAHILLAELYLYQPAQIHWGEDSIAMRDKNLKIGYKHLMNALDFDQKNQKGLSLLKMYRDIYKSAQTAGRESKPKDTL
ncbi:MAG: hypothetical protein R2827_06595 [Bdellovibrionales bacterium]